VLEIGLHFARAIVPYLPRNDAQAVDEITDRAGRAARVLPGELRAMLAALG
jgi:hypothetical protein